MSRANEHIHGSSRLHRVLGLGLSGAALVGLIYFEGMSARAEAGAGLQESLVEVDESDELDELDETVDSEEDGAGINVPAPVMVALPPAGAAPEAASPTTSPAPAQLAMADLGAVEATAMPTEPPVPTLVAVPDIEGMSLRKARKQLKALGLKLSVRDGYNEKIPREYWGEYRVRTQKTEAGTEVEPGATVKVKARMLQRYAMGY
jgi:PASTA domain